MAESQAHGLLVLRTHYYITRRFASHPAFAALVDAADTLRGDKPPRIGGYVPDVLGMDVPTTFHVIGEAKTEDDIDRPHTTAQLVAYLRHLRLRGGILVVAVPIFARPRARRVVGMAMAVANAGAVEIVILDDLAPWA